LFGEQFIYVNVVHKMCVFGVSVCVFRAEIFRKMEKASASQALSPVHLFKGFWMVFLNPQ